MTDAINPLADLHTIAEAAAILSISESRLRARLSEGALVAQEATREQIAALFAQNRIAGVPGSGIRLLSSATLSEALTKSRRRAPKHT